MGGVIFHEKQGTLRDCYKAWGTVTLPASSYMLADAMPTFVSYVLFGCHREDDNGNPIGNFDAGLQVCGQNQYKLCLNGGNALEINTPDGKSWYEKAFTKTGSSSSVKFGIDDTSIGYVDVVDYDEWFYEKIDIEFPQ